MKRKIEYICDFCGKSFRSSLECSKHEKSCTNKYYLCKQYKKRLMKYLNFIESQGLRVGIMYNTFSKVVSVVDIKVNNS